MRTGAFLGRGLFGALTLVAVIAAPGAGQSAAPAATPDTVPWQLAWADGAVFYEVFVRSFADSDGNGVGDFKGLTARLDYLNDGNPATFDDLGVDALWLMPVFASPSYHGYDTVDYETVNPDYGSNSDFERFLAAAHRRGIRVILDLVINHTGKDHPWFVDSASSPSSPKRDWYVWRPDDPGWKQPWGDGPTWHPMNGAYYYGIFWSGMPDLNLENPEVRAEVVRVARLWLDRGVDGFRLDAARHIVAEGPGELQNDTGRTHAFWREFSAAIRSSHPDALLVGENWTTSANIASYYGDTARVRGGDELPMSFNFPLASAVLDAVKSGSAQPVLDAFAIMKMEYPAGVMDAAFLANHDMVRVASILDNDQRKLRTAASILLTLPGTPFLYYGEELGMQNGPRTKGDPAKRTPMPWIGGPAGGFTTGTPWYELSPGWETSNVAVESADPASLLNHYRALIRLRRCSAALRLGALETLTVPAGALAYVRELGPARVLVVHNLGASALSAELSLSAASAELAYASGAGAGLTKGTPWTVTLPAGVSAIWRLINK